MVRFLLLFMLCSSLFAEETNTKIHGVHKSHIAFALMDIESGKLMTSHQPTREMILASVSKVFTYFYALKNLGPTHQFKTELFYKGDIKDGVLEGDIYLKGHGDPYLGAPQLLSLAHALRLKGITKVKGNFYADGEALLSSSSVSVLGLSDQADNPAISGLNVEFNRYDIWSRQDLVYPPVDSLKITKRRKSDFGLRFEFEKMRGHEENWFQNTKEYIPPINSIPTKDATYFTANYFRFLATRMGVSLPSPTKGDLADATPLYTHLGISFSKIAELGLEYSNNLMAEASLQATSKKLTTVAQDSRFSVQTMMNWYKKNYPEVPWKDIKLINGSGLTIHNRISPKSMTLYLRALFKETIEGRSYLSYLSVNGHSGGIRRRLNHPNLAFRVFAKTGTLYYVNNMAGYLIGQSGKIYAFAFFSTHHDNRETMSGDKAKQKMYLRRKSSDWNKLSTEAMDQVLEEWIKKY